MAPSPTNTGVFRSWEKSAPRRHAAAASKGVAAAARPNKYLQATCGPDHSHSHSEAESFGRPPLSASQRPPPCGALLCASPSQPSLAYDFFRLVSRPPVVRLPQRLRRSVRGPSRPFAHGRRRRGSRERRRRERCSCCLFAIQRACAVEYVPDHSPTVSCRSAASQSWRCLIVSGQWTSLRAYATGRARGCPRLGTPTAQGSPRR